MSGRSRSSATPLPWQLAVVLAIACLGWIQEASCLRTTPYIGKYTKEKLDSLRGEPVEEPEEIVTEAVVIPVREPSNSAYQVGIVAKSTASPQEAIGEGGNGTVKSLYTGIPQIDYLLDPNLPRELNGYNLTNYPFYVAVPPDISFKCDGLHDGFYASVPHKCQVYHHCLFGTRYDFLCANYTAFDQKTFICHFVSEVDCDNSPKYYKRNEALYKAATTTTTSTTTTTTTTTPAPPPVQQSSQSSGGRVGQGGRKRRPLRRRRPQYDYYYDDDYAEEDDEYSRPAQPARRRKKKPSTSNRDRQRAEDDDFSEEEDFPDEEEYVNRRRKQKPRTRPQSSRRPIEDDFEDEYEDDPPEKNTGSAALVPVGTPASRGKGVFDKPRAPPKIRPPVPLSEREKYNYGQQGAAGSSSPATSPSKPSYSEPDEEYNDRRNKKRPQTAVRDEDSEEEIPERRTKKRPTQPPRRVEVPEDEVPERRIKKRPTQPPPQASVRDEHYYEDDEEEEYERIPPSRGSNQNRRRKGQGSTRVEQVDSEEDDYEYKNPSSSRDTTRYSSSSGSRESSRRRKRPLAAASSVPARRRRPSYRQEEDDYSYEDEENTRVRPSNTRTKDTQLKESDEEEYIDKAPPTRNPPPRSSDDAPTRKRVQPTNFRSSFSEDRPRPLSSVHSNRKRLPAPVHEEPEEDRSAEEVLEEEEEEEIPPPPKERARGGDRVRIKSRFSTTTTTTTTTTPKPPPPPRIASRTTSTSTPIPAREKDLYEDEDDGYYYESEEIHEKEPKTPEPVNSRRPFRPSGPGNQNGGSFAISGRSVPATAPQAFLPRGLQALGDRAQRKDSAPSVTSNNSTPKPKPTSYTTTATTTTTTPSVSNTKAYKKDEPKYFERPLSITSNPPSFKQQTQYNARQPTPKQETQESPQVTSYSRAPFISNARPGYTTKSLPSQLYPQKPQQNIVPPQVPVDSVPNQTDYEEDDFINDALHPTIPSSPGFPATAAASSLTTRHGIPLSQQQRTTLSTPTQLSYRFRNAAQSSPVLDYRVQQPSNPSFTSRGVPLHTSASQQTISVIQPPQFISQPNQQRVALRAVQQPLQQLLHQQGSNPWNSPTRIVVY